MNEGLSNAAQGFGTSITGAGTHFIEAVSSILDVIASKEILSAIILVVIVRKIFQKFQPR